MEIESLGSVSKVIAARVHEKAEEIKERGIDGSHVYVERREYCLL